MIPLWGALHYPDLKKKKQKIGETFQTYNYRLRLPDLPSPLPAFSCVDMANGEPENFRLSESRALPSFPRCRGSDIYYYEYHLY